MKTILIYKKSNLIGSSGGIEKVLSWLSNGLSQAGYNVYLTTRDRHDGNLFYPIDDAVHFHHFHPKFSRLRRIIGQITRNKIPYFNRELYIANMIRAYCDEIKPDVIMTAGVQDLADIVYNAPYSCRKIVQLHSAPSVIFTKKKKKLFTQTLKSADAVQVLLPIFIPELKQFYAGKATAIGNAVPANTQTATKKPIIIYTGRVEPDKQQLIAINAFAAIAEKHKDWQLHFWGSVVNKEYYESCMDVVHQHHLEEQVIFNGLTNEIQAKLAESSICAFPSKYEGFGLGLVEAMAAQVPCVGLTSCPAVNQLIKNNVNGLLVKDTDEFALALDRLITDSELRKSMGQAALETSKQYDPEIILQQWINLIEDRV